ncbi:MAG TPA: SIS domain-containing protein [Candidatus Limnocylindria bacterium]|nr:SIS domain-containing protein [Candidatus Limnocylindria bacterium]
MTSVQETYLAKAKATLDRLASEEADAILRAGVAVADRVAEDRLIYVIGPGGHSQIGAEEVFSRAGGLAAIYAFIDDGFYLGHGAARSMRIERTPGYARALLAEVAFDRGDLLIIVNAYGINSATIDSAMYAHELGMTTIGVTSVANQRGLPQGHPSRHPSGKDLCDLVDIVVDTKMPLGDALLEIDGVSQAVGPVSTIVNAFALNAIMLEAMAELVRRGIDPPVWKSSNSPGGDEANLAVTARYRGRVPNL